MNAPRVIRKYANRKLYDTQARRYVTLEAVSQMVREGQDVVVVERESGRDVTSLVLSRAVVREESVTSSDDGAQVHDRGQAFLGYLRRSLSGSAALMTAEAGKRRSVVEDWVEAAVDRALARLSIPSRKDADQLAQRLDQLERRLAAMEEKVPKSEPAGGGRGC